jgi:hypothetical protein
MHHPPPDWATYAACPTCHAAVGDPCRVSGFIASTPHPLRDTTAQPSLFEMEPK